MGSTSLLKVTSAASAAFPAHVPAIIPAIKYRNMPESYHAPARANRWRKMAWLDHQILGELSHLTMTVATDDSAADRESDQLRVENARLTRSLAEKEVLIRELHHRAKNNLQIIASLLRLQAKAASQEIVSALLQQSEYRLEAMAMIHEQLNASADFCNLHLAQQAKLLMTNLFSAYGVDPARTSGQVTVCPRPDGTPLGIDYQRAQARVSRWPFRPHSYRGPGRGAKPPRLREPGRD
jgi:hypothetical protein